MAVKPNHVEVHAMDLVELCNLASREIERRVEAGKADGDPQAVMSARAQSDRVRRLLTAAVGRLGGAVEVPGRDSTAGGQGPGTGDKGGSTGA
ncbi:MAG: hypothetical protein KC492_16170 [Myxococcales bacterium]|nr:hypothetical protein [Myxococcales bacterium]